MRSVIGISLMVLGVAFGLYVGIWLMFIGGIVDLVEIVVTANEVGDVTPMGVAIGIAKIVFAGPIGSFVGGVIAFFGFNIWTSQPANFRGRRGRL